LQVTHIKSREAHHASPRLFPGVALTSRPAPLVPRISPNSIGKLIADFLSCAKGPLVRPATRSSVCRTREQQKVNLIPLRKRDGAQAQRASSSSSSANAPLAGLRQPGNARLLGRPTSLYGRETVNLIRLPVSTSRRERQLRVESVLKRARLRSTFRLPTWNTTGRQVFRFSSKQY